MKKIIHTYTLHAFTRLSLLLLLLQTQRLAARSLETGNPDAHSLASHILISDLDFEEGEKDGIKGLHIRFHASGEGPFILTLSSVNGNDEQLFESDRQFFQKEEQQHLRAFIPFTQLPLEPGKQGLNYTITHSQDPNEPLYQGRVYFDQPRVFHGFLDFGPIKLQGKDYDVHIGPKGNAAPDMQWELHHGSKVIWSSAIRKNNHQFPAFELPVEFSEGERMELVLWDVDPRPVRKGEILAWIKLNTDPGEGCIEQHFPNPDQGQFDAFRVSLILQD